MSEKSNSGGAAFPSCGADGQGPHGMTLRDYFAGRVLEGKAGFRTLGTVEEQELCASQCYSMADAMLAERKKNL